MEKDTIDIIETPRKISIFLLPILILFYCSPVFSQPKWQLEIQGVIMENEKPLAGAKISSYIQGVEQDVVITNAKGGFKIYLKAGAQYLVKMTKAGGYITKVVSFDTRNVPSSEDNNKNFNFPLGASLFKEFKGLDPAILREPIGKVSYDPNKRQFIEDETYTRNVQNRLDAAIKAMELAKALEEEFNNLYRKAEKLVLNENFEDALIELNKAADLQINDALVKSKIAEVNALIKRRDDANVLILQQSLETNTSKFNELISEGDMLMNDDSPELALNRYKEALTLNINDELANEKIKIVTSQLLKIKEKSDSTEFANRKKKEFDRLINYGSLHMKSGYFREAEDCYKKASELKFDSIRVNLLLNELAYKLAGENEKLRKKREAEERRNAYLEKARLEREAARFELIHRLEARNSALAESARTKLERDQQRYTEKKEFEMLADESRKSLRDKYSEGVTREETEGSNYLMTRVIVVNGEQVAEYKKLQYSFGPTYYLKNGKDITEATFNQETK
jgi:tetratricopeptide (TPR) repeat protein